MPVSVSVCPFCGKPSPATFDGIASEALVWYVCLTCRYIWAVSRDNPGTPIKVMRPKEEEPGA